MDICNVFTGIQNVALRPMDSFAHTAKKNLNPTRSRVGASKKDPEMSAMWRYRTLRTSDSTTDNTSSVVYRSGDDPLV